MNLQRKPRHFAGQKNNEILTNLRKRRPAILLCRIMTKPKKQKSSPMHPLLACLLSQLSPTMQRRVVAYVSRVLTPTERRYSQTEREALGIVWAVQRLHADLYGGKFNFTQNVNRSK